MESSFREQKNHHRVFQGFVVVCSSGSGWAVRCVTTAGMVRGLSRGDGAVLLQKRDTQMLGWRREAEK